MALRAPSRSPDSRFTAADRIEPTAALRLRVEATDGVAQLHRVCRGFGTELVGRDASRGGQERARVEAGVAARDRVAEAEPRAAAERVEHRALDERDAEAVDEALARIVCH